MERNVMLFLSLAAYIFACNAQTVDELPIIKDLPAEVLYRAKQPFSLNCSVIGGEGKSIKYSWEKDHTPLTLKSDSKIVQQQNGALAFQEPSSEEEGQYQCFAESEYGKASSRVVSVKLTFLNYKTESHTHKPVEGKPYKLDCPKPVAYPEPVISWIRQHKTDPSKNTNLLGKENTPAPDGALYMASIIKEYASDEFKYVCQASSPALDTPVTLAEHTIEQVIENKEPVNGELIPQYLTQAMVVKAGDITMIYCIYGGSPYAYADWWYESTSLSKNDYKNRITRYNRSAARRLLIRDTYLSDQGNYTCQADNGVGKPQRHSIFLTVVSAPKFSKKSEPKMIVKEGQDVIIPCQVTGLKVPSIAWSHNAKTLTKTERISYNESISNNTVVADLTIKNVQKSDKGYYGCTAVNNLGDEYVETLLHVV